MLLCPASRARLSAVLRSRAMMRGPLPVRIREASTLGDVADVVDAVLDAPVALQPAGQQPGIGLGVGQ
jgi:hypothetical protein